MTSTAQKTGITKAVLKDRPKLSIRFKSLTAALAVLLIAIIVVPLLVMVLRLFFPGGAFNSNAFVRIWNMPGLWEMLLNTAILITGGTLFALFFGALFAWLNERTDARMGWIAEALPTFPLFVPPMASAVGWLLLGTPGPGFLNVAIRGIMSFLGLNVPESGPFDVFSWYGLILMYGIVLLPQVYITISAALRNLDPALEEASRIAGKGPVATFFSVTLPAIVPAILNGTFLALTAGFALFSVPAVIGKQAGIDVITVRIVELTSQQYPADLAGGMVLGLVIIAALGATWLVQRKLSKKARHAMITGRAASSLIPLRIWKWPMRCLLVLYGLAVVVFPILALVVVSFQKFWSGTLSFANFTWSNWSAIFASGGTLRDSVTNSLTLGVLAASVSILVAALVGYMLSQNKSHPLSVVVDSVTKLPASLSHVVIAVALLASFAAPPIVMPVVAILLIAYIVMYIPLAFISAENSLNQIGSTMTEASLMSRASLGRTFVSVIFPLMRPGLITGWVLVFVNAFGDLTASVMLAKPSNPVVGFVMLDLNTQGTFGTLAAMGAFVSLIGSIIGTLVLVLGSRQRYDSKM